MIDEPQGDGDEIVRSIAGEMGIEFTPAEIERLIQDDRFATTAYLYRLAARHTGHEDSLECDYRVRTVLERATREHAQRVTGEYEGMHTR